MKYFLIFLFTLNNFTLKAQKNNDLFFTLDENFEPTKNINKAFYYLNQEKINDTTFRNCFYIDNLILNRVETYSDKDFSLPNGFFAYYNTNGQLDSCGYVKDGKRNQYWYFYNALDLKNPDFCILKKYYENGILKPIDNIATNDNNKYTKPEYKNFNNFLLKNMTFPIEALSKRIGGIVKAKFTVDEHGKLSNFYFQKSANFYLDNELIRLLKLSEGKWKPATKNEVPIKAEQLQSMSFVIGF